MLFFGKKKRCLTNSQLLDFVLDRILATPVESAIDIHLSECNPCRIRLADLLTSMDDEQRSAFERSTEVRQGFHRIAAAGDTSTEVVAFWASEDGDTILRLEKDHSGHYFLSLILSDRNNATTWMLQWAEKRVPLDIKAPVRLPDGCLTMIHADHVFVTDGSDTLTLERRTP